MINVGLVAVSAALTAILIRVPAPEYLPSRRWVGEPGNGRADLAAGSLLKTKVSRLGGSGCR